MDALKVLLVDDEVEFVTTLAERLGLRGIEARAATNGERALEHIEADPPQVVILDLMMPGIGGMEVLRRLRQQYPDIRVVLLTGHGCVAENLEAMSLGASECLMKPVDIDELIKIIQRVRW